MTVDRERLRQIDRIFDEALDLEGAERERFVDENCGADAELRESVERLLRAADRPQIQPGGALLGNFGDELLLHLEDDEHHPGSQVGPYRLIREIGTSGAAVVFLAAHEQDEFGEEVVLKLFRAEPESALSGWARKKSESWTDEITLVDGRTEPLEPELLEADADGAENQVPVDGELLGLEHPGIVELLDAGYAEDGRVFVIMEHVEGDRLDEYCDQRSLGIAERLELFVQLCEALQFAHSSLVTHGDLKLSSVL
ncbi:MAG: protein kinase, partial [Acidobacteriota bacterium]